MSHHMNLRKRKAPPAPIPAFVPVSIMLKKRGLKKKVRFALPEDSDEMLAEQLKDKNELEVPATNLVNLPASSIKNVEPKVICELLPNAHYIPFNIEERIRLSNEPVTVAVTPSRAGNIMDEFSPQYCSTNNEMPICFQSSSARVSAQRKS